MAVIREWFCAAHGPFTSTEPRCKYGCTFTVERRFFTAPSVHTGKTKATDRILARLAEQYGLSDMSNRAGSVAASARKSGVDLTPRWEKLPQGNALVIGEGEQQREGSEGGAQAAGDGFRTQQIRDEIHATKERPLPVPGKVPKFRPNVVGKDTVTADDFRAATERVT